jgi:hypothetical protein
MGRFREIIMRWSILRTLLHKEALRHLANRGGIVLVLLLVVASMLLSFFGNGSAAGQAGLLSGVQLCYVDYAENTPLVEHLRANVPAEMVHAIRFRSLADVPTNERGQIVYPHNTGAIQLRRASAPNALVKAWFWHPGSDSSSLAPFEVWFWKETLRFALSRNGRPAPRSDATLTDLPAFIESDHSSLTGGMDPRSGLATSLVLFGLFFVCVYLLPSLTCEERERGVLLAQALSPASPQELLAAKFLFYPVIGLGLAALLAGMYEPSALLRPFFWLGLVVSVVGSMGIGLTIASLARTQRAASMGAMCYMMAVALLLFICRQNGIPGLPYLALEYHCPRILHAALTHGERWYHWVSLTAAAGIAVVWCVLAGVLFRRRGWQ